MGRKGLKTCAPSYFCLYLPALSGCTKPWSKPIRCARAGLQRGPDCAGRRRSIPAKSTRGARRSWAFASRKSRRAWWSRHAVKPGQVLARLDPTDAQLAAAAARAPSRRSRVRGGQCPAELVRAQKLVGRKFISRPALDARNHADKTARAQCVASRAQLDISANSSYGPRRRATRGRCRSGARWSAAGSRCCRVAYGRRQRERRFTWASTGAPDQAGRAGAVRCGRAPARHTRRGARGSPAADENRTYLVKATITQADEAVRLGMTASVLFAGCSGAGATIGVAGRGTGSAGPAGRRVGGRTPGTR